MQWNKEQIKNHKKAAKILAGIKNEAFDIIRKKKNITEYYIQQFVLKRFKDFKLETVITPIVAFGKNTCNVHYYPSRKSEKLKPDTLIMLDIWAKMKEKNSPFADVTFMAFKGSRVPKKIIDVSQIIFEARDKAINFIRSNLKRRKVPTGAQIDKVARGFIKKKGYGKYFLHRTGHSLGFEHVHGKEKSIHFDNNNPILKNVGYTNEPGIYLKNKFGVRSEIDFYIDDNYKIIITSEVQNKITIL
jgi:Xaa-Pro dipeptidase